MSDSLQPHELQHARPPCPSPTPGVYSNSCPSSQWWHPAILSSVVPFSSCPQSLPASAPNPSPCSETWLIEQMIIVSDVLTFIMTLVCVVLSYTYIIKTILQFLCFQQKKKAFSTCSSHFIVISITSVQFGSVTQLCLTLWDPMNRSMPGLPVHHQLPEFTQTHAHWVSDAIQPPHPLSSPSPAPNPSQHQDIFQWVNSSHKLAKVLEF